ncbi:MAG TPA: hypothetical protein EYP77_04135 [Anaerolineae bacterium]|nr:hypothetical protein [Anaerolineae bacterium]
MRDISDLPFDLAI